MYSNRPDLTWDGHSIPLAGNSVESVVCTEVLEHCPHPQQVLAETFRVLKPAGVLFLTVPFLWPLHDIPFDEYRYTPFALTRHMEAVGYTVMQMKALGGWDASLAQMIGLWVRRRPMPERARRILQRLLWPVHRWLIRRDRPPRSFTQSAMITGLAAVSRKPPCLPVPVLP